MGFEPTTFSLARRRSTTELHPRVEPGEDTVNGGTCQGRLLQRTPVRASTVGGNRFARQRTTRLQPFNAPAIGPHRKNRPSRM